MYSLCLTRKKRERKEGKKLREIGEAGEKLRKKKKERERINHGFLDDERKRENIF